ADPKAARTVTYGTSQMGWAWADGTSGPFAAPQRLRPPSGWAVIWSDPGLGQVPGTPNVFMTMDAIPDVKFPCNRRDRSGRCTQRGVIAGPVNPFAGGACVARSTDGGKTFGVAAKDCLHTPNFDFYDGSEIVGSKGGTVLAAFADATSVALGGIHVWRARTPTGAFAQLPNPFPNLAAGGHPRMIASHSGMGNETGRIYLAAGVGNTELWLQMYDPVTDGWGHAPFWPKRVATDFWSAAVPSHGILIQNGPGLSLVASDLRNSGENVSVVYMSEHPSGTHTILKLSACFPNDTSGQCTVLPDTIDMGSDAFAPTVAVGNRLFGEETIYKTAWLQQSDVGAPSIGVFSADFGYPFGGVANIRQESDYQLPCDSTGTHYWGDYDNHMGVYQPTVGSQNPLFFRSFSDSRDDFGARLCTEQTYWASTLVHVAQVTITP
ncbi:MAG: hypothetical protein M3O46_19965, partial [Myxococcota bacterium]|nr:hypothetical protein [Myxococcota bacterium]